MKYDLVELRKFLPDYVDTITKKRKYKKYNCPLCNSGMREGGTPAFNLYGEDNTRCHCFSCGFDGDIISLYMAVNQMVESPSTVGVSIRALGSMYHLQPIDGTAPVKKYQTKGKREKTGSRVHIYKDKNGNIIARKSITMYSDGSKSPFWSLYHPETRTYSNGLKGVKIPLYHADILHETTSKSIFFVEGEKDADTMSQLDDIPATTIPNGAGFTQWLDIYNEGLEGKDIIILTDNDDVGRKYGHKVAENAIKIANSVKIIPPTAIWSECPEKGDISDIVKAIGKDEASALLVDAIQRTEFYHPEPPQAEQMQDELSDSNLPYWIMKSNKKLKVIPELLAEYIAETENYIFVQLKDQEEQRCFWYQNGVYSRISAKHLKSKIRDIIASYSLLLAKINVIENTYTHITYPKAKHFVSDEALLDADENIINFQNGILHLDTMQLTPHSPEYLCTIQIPCNWNPQSANNNNVFHNYIMHLANDDWSSAETLIQAIGFAVSNVKIERFKKSLILCGAGNSGKSIFLKFMSALIGRENFTALPFEKLDKRFSTSMLYRKRLAGDDDCNYGNYSSISVFKSVTGGGELMCEEKGKQSFPFVFNGLYVICANDLPLFSGDKGSHVYERIIPIKCGATVPEEKRDKKLLEKLYGEREAIVYLAVLELKKAIEQNYRFSISAESKKLLHCYEIENDIVLQFMNECCEPRKKYDAITVTAMYEAFKRWCIDGGEKYIPKKKDFRKSICKFYGADTTNEGHKKIVKKVKGTYYYMHTLTNEAKQELRMYDSILNDENNV